MDDNLKKMISELQGLMGEGPAQRLNMLGRGPMPPNSLNLALEAIHGLSEADIDSFTFAATRRGEEGNYILVMGGNIDAIHGCVGAILNKCREIIDAVDRAEGGNGES